MMSFRLPRIAASAAVSGQSLSGFGLRVRGTVTPGFLLAVKAFVHYDADGSRRRLCGLASGCWRVSEGTRDHRDAHVSHEAGPAELLPGDLPLEVNPRAPRHRDENPRPVSLRRGSGHLLLHARLSRPPVARADESEILRRVAVEKRAGARTDPDVGPVRRRARRRRRRPHPLVNPRFEKVLRF